MGGLTSTGRRAHLASFGGGEQLRLESGWVGIGLRWRGAALRRLGPRGVLQVVDPSGREVGPTLSETNAQYLLVDWLPTGILFWQDPYFSMSVAADGLTLYTRRVGASSPPKALAVTLPYSSWVEPSPDGTAVALVVGKGRETWLNKSVVLCTLPDGRCRDWGRVPTRRSPWTRR